MNPATHRRFWYFTG